MKGAGGAISSIADAASGKHRWAAIAQLHKSSIINVALAFGLIIFFGGALLHMATAFLAIPFDEKIFLDVMRYLWSALGFLIAGKTVDIGLNKKGMQRMADNLNQKMEEDEEKERQEQIDLIAKENGSSNKEHTVQIIRDYKKKVTIGSVFYKDQLIGKVFELPRTYKGKKNVQGKTCILESVYKYRKEPYSQSGKFKATGVYRLFDVHNRTGILIHPANYVTQLRGCLSPFTSKVGFTYQYSKKAFRELEKHMGLEGVVKITS